VALREAICAVAASFRAQLAEDAPHRLAELEPWFGWAEKFTSEATEKLDSEAADAARVRRTALRSGMDVMVMAPQDVPLGALTAWFGRYMKDRKHQLALAECIVGLIKPPMSAARKAF